MVSAALGAAALAHHGYGLELAASLAAIALAVIAALSLPRADKARMASEHDYLTHLRLGLGLDSAARRRNFLVTKASCRLFSAIVLALGGALEEFWPIFGIKVGLSRPIIALFVGVQSAVEMLASLLAHRVSRLATRRIYGLFTLVCSLLAAAAGLFSPPAMILLALYSGLLKMIDVVFEGRLQHAIPSDRRATIGSVKGFAGEIGVTVLYLAFGPLAQATSYRIAFKPPAARSASSSAWPIWSARAAGGAAKGRSLGYSGRLRRSSRYQASCSLVASSLPSLRQ